MSEVEYDEEQMQLSEAQRIASSTTAKEYFLTEQANLLDEWGQRSLDLFKFTAEVFMKEYEIKSSELTEDFGQKYDGIYSKCRKEFEAYCILNRKVQKKNDQIENFAAFFNSKNHKKTFFHAWKEHSGRQKKLRAMEDKCEKYKQSKTMKNCLKGWLQLTMKSNRMKIKNEVLHRTEVEITKVQEQYEKIICTLEENLEKKLTQLKKEEEQHRLLHDKYENMYARNKGDSRISN